LGFQHISSPLGQSGHFGCSIWMVITLSWNCFKFFIIHLSQHATYAVVHIRAAHMIVSWLSWTWIILPVLIR
jgi:hypothetical protein